MKIKQDAKYITIILSKNEAAAFVMDLENKTPHIALGIVDTIGDKLKTLITWKKIK